MTGFMTSLAIRLVLVLLGVLWLLPAHAQGKRIALLIANETYKPGVGRLLNPINDTRLVGQALKVVGFEVVKPVENGTRAAILLAVHEFAEKLKAAGPDAVGFLYYSGHGVASAGENYIVPVDIDEPSTTALVVKGVKQSEILSALRTKAPNAAHYVVLDACRNNLQGARGGKGFVPVGQQSGVLIAFSTRPGDTASDIGERSGPYAAALAAEIVKPGQNDLLMFHNVRIEVIRKTGGDQVPWTEDGIQRPERISFGGTTPGSAGTLPPPLGEAAQAWAATKDTTSVAALETFARRFRGSVFADMAKARIDELARQQAQVEKQRVADAAAAAKVIAEARAAAEAKAAAESKKAEDDKRLADAKAAADARLASLKQAGESKQQSNALTLVLSTGEVRIRLRPDLAPKHVERVRQLAREGFYNGLKFHRVISNFMAQTGDPTGTGRGGSKYPDLTAEFTNEVYKRGTVGAARTTNPNSANSQFFICFNDSGCRGLTSQYTVWGEVVSGMENVDKLAVGDPPGSPSTIVTARIN